MEETEKNNWMVSIFDFSFVVILVRQTGSRIAYRETHNTIHDN